MEECLFCESPLRKDANFCTSCGKKVPTKRSAPRSVEQAQETPQLRTKLFQELTGNIFASKAQLVTLQHIIAEVKFPDIRKDIKKIFLSPTNIYVKKVFLDRYGAQVDAILQEEKEIPESSKYLTRIYS